LFALLVLYMATATKKKRKVEAYLWKAGARSGHTTKLKQSILRLSISMVTKHQIHLFFALSIFINLGIVN